MDIQRADPGHRPGNPADEVIGQAFTERGVCERVDTGGVGARRLSPPLRVGDDLTVERVSSRDDCGEQGAAEHRAGV